MIKFDDLGLQLNDKVVDIKWGEDIIISIRQYLPVEEKTQLIQYVINAALDDSTGCFSPLRLEVYFSLGVCSKYTDIEIESLADAGSTYDLLDSSGLMSMIMSNIPKEELNFMRELVMDTANDIARYNNSAAGIIQGMSGDATNLDNQLSDILNNLQNGEGAELIKVFKDMVEND